MTIVYSNTLERFYEESPFIPDLLAGADHDCSVRDTAQYRAWSNSLQFVQNMLMMAHTPTSCGVLIEFRLPSTSRRVDFIITGHDKNGSANFVVIELKQWSQAQPVIDKPGIVQANVAGSRTEETSHPCYQAWSYKMFLENMLDTVSTHQLHAYACAYMHNYPYSGLQTDPLAAAPNQELVRSTPLFGRHDRQALGSFIQQYVECGDGAQIMQLITEGRVVPSRRLVESIGSMFDEARPNVFTLIDEQKLAYESILSAVRQTPLNQKRCLIISGGPGTGKSVVAMSALVAILREFKNDERRRNIRFVSPTSSFRQAMISMLSGSGSNKVEQRQRKTLAKNLFCGSMSFFIPSPDQSKCNVFPRNHYHCLLCDEAHRLHSHQNMYRGCNQIEDIIHACAVSVFFVDDNQALRPYDIGSVESIRKAALKYSVPVTQIDLAAQFRCQGAEGFMNWLGTVLGLLPSDSGNAYGWDQTAFSFEIADTPEEVIAFVDQKNQCAQSRSPIAGHSIIAGARLLAGYAWPWSKDGNKHGEVLDVDLGSIRLPWNNRTSSYEWAIDPNTKERHEVGCVHTSQGLEFEWVGVFIGNDLRYDPKTHSLFADIDHYHDVGGKKGLGANHNQKMKSLLTYICRCYRVLLSRGVYGARVYCCDKNLADYLRQELAKAKHLSAEQ